MVAVQGARARTGPVQKRRLVLRGPPPAKIRPVVGVATPKRCRSARVILMRKWQELYLQVPQLAAKPTGTFVRPT